VRRRWRKWAPGRSSTSKTRFGTDRQPRRVVVIGGGYIGIEATAVLTGLGKSLTVSDGQGHCDLLAALAQDRPEGVG